VESLFRYIETSEQRNKIVRALGTYVPPVGILVSILLLVDKYL